MKTFICTALKICYGLSFKFNANRAVKYNETVYLFFKDNRQRDDFIIKLFLNAFCEKKLFVTIEDNVVQICTNDVKIEEVII